MILFNNHFLDLINLVLQTPETVIADKPTCWYFLYVINFAMCYLGASFCKAKNSHSRHGPTQNLCECGAKRKDCISSKRALHNIIQVHAPHWLRSVAFFLSSSLYTSPQYSLLKPPPKFICL